MTSSSLPDSALWSAALILPSTTAANRPVRQRKTVTHYSDDNPSTFTVKVKKKRGVSAVDDGDAEEQQLVETNKIIESISTTTPGRPKRDESSGTLRPREPERAPLEEQVQCGRRRRPPHRRPSSATSSLSNVPSRHQTPSSTTSKSPRSGSRTKSSSLATACLTKTEATTAAATNEAVVSSKLNEYTPQCRKRKYRVISNNATAEPPCDRILSHLVTIQPILPVVAPWMTQTTASLNATSTHTTAAASFANPATVTAPTPVPVLSSVCSRSQQLAATCPPPQPELLSNLFPKPALHQQSPPISCFTVRQDDSRYAVMGDAAGRCVLLRLVPKVQTLTELPTLASAATNRLVVKSKTVIHYPHALVACQWRKNRVVTVSLQECQIWDVSTQACLWTWLVATDTPGVNDSTNKTLPKTPWHFSFNNGGLLSPLSGATGEIQLDWNERNDLLWISRSGPTLLVDTNDFAVRNDNDNDKDEFAATQTKENNLSSCSLWVCQEQSLVDCDRCNDAKPILRKVPFRLQKSDKVFLQCLTAIWEERPCERGSQNADDTVSSPSLMDNCSILMVVLVTSKNKTNIGSENLGPSHNSCKGAATNKILPQVDLMRVDATTFEPLMCTSVLAPSLNMYNRSGTWMNDFRLQRPSRDVNTSAITLLCSCKGIRVYDTATLTCLYVYGEAVALHGKTVSWQACLTMPQPQHRPQDVCVGMKKHTFLQHEDELSRRVELEHKNSGETADAQGLLLVGVPSHSREPIELQSILYVWRLGQVHPVATLQVPKGGLLGLSLQQNTSGWSLVCVTAEFGQVWEWKAGFKSNFAGVQYPVGYNVVDDNCEYIEDEDELDVVIEAVEDDQEIQEDGEAPIGATLGSFATSPSINQRLWTGDVMDVGLVEALRLSQSANAEMDRVSVLDEHFDIDEPLVSCRPDLVVNRLSMEDENDAYESLTEKPSINNEIFAVFPQLNKVRTEIKVLTEQQTAITRETEIEEKLVQSSAFNLPTKPRGRRSRPANIEVVLQSSVKTVLRREMLLRSRTWVDGLGSKLQVDSWMPLQHKYTNSKATEEHGYEVESLSKILDERYSGNCRSGNDVEDSSLPLVSTKVSAEEKELALELLLLSPSPNRSSIIELATDSTKHTEPDSDKVNANLTSSTEKFDHWNDSIVTPSDRSPSHNTNLCQGSEDELKMTKEIVKLPFCAACQGRMVRHSCGIRQKPIDYEAIAQAEREMKEREEAEKLQKRVEKRKAAEARRREARRIKKEENDCKRQEEARVCWTEGEPSKSLDDVEREYVPEHEVEPLCQDSKWRLLQDSLLREPEQDEETPLQYDVSLSKDLVFSSKPMSIEGHCGASTTVVDQESSLYTLNDQGVINSTQVQKSSACTTSQDQLDEREKTNIHSYSSRWNESCSTQTHQARDFLDCFLPKTESLQLQMNGIEITPSTALSSSDALAALAGLATATTTSLYRQSYEQSKDKNGLHEHKHTFDSYSYLDSTSLKNDSNSRYCNLFGASLLQTSNNDVSGVGCQTLLYAETDTPSSFSVQHGESNSIASQHCDENYQPLPERFEVATHTNLPVVYSSRLSNTM